MKKTVRGMLNEMFAANYDEVYTLGAHKYRRYKNGQITKEAIEAFILDGVKRGCLSPRVEKMYNNFVKGLN